VRRRAGWIAAALLAAACSSQTPVRRPRVTPAAPTAVGPYCQAIEGAGLLFVSGQIGIDPATGELSSPETRGQVEQALKNVTIILEAAGLTCDDVVKTTVFLVDLEDYAGMNEVYARSFKNAPPARSTVQVAKLPKGARVEIEAIAMMRG